ncbi:MAG: hypothetical protein H0W90_02220 [Actinobacteria bacterium]|nr:hypothetical protein [Actinomycetota bacterium]
MKLVLLVAVVVGVLILAPSAGSTAGKPWLWQCTQIHNVEAQYNCYVRLLRNDIEASRNPAHEVPRIDSRVAAIGGPAEAGCHVLMHQVGREFARDHHVTLGSLQRYVPRSNNPNCSAGFGMGLVMYLGPQIIRSGGASAVRSCAALPTRYREYTCVHGLGHALLRAYHGNLGQSVRACRALQRAYAPDCAQGVFHDYWISLRGADGTRAPKRTISPHTLCDGRLTYIRPCWYRYFLEQPLALPVRDAADLRRSCRGLHALERYGCISAAALTISSNPFDQMHVCERLGAADASACLRGVPDQALAGRASEQVRLIRACARVTPGAREGCYEWLGRTLSVVTNGTFRERGCTKLSPQRARRACVTGASRMRAALVTFS